MVLLSRQSFSWLASGCGAETLRCILLLHWNWLLHNHHHAKGVRPPFTAYHPLLPRLIEHANALCGGRRHILQAILQTTSVMSTCWKQSHVCCSAPACASCFQSTPSHGPSLNPLQHLHKRRLRENTTAVYKYWKDCHMEDRASFSPSNQQNQVTSGTESLRR